MLTCKGSAIAASFGKGEKSRTVLIPKKVYAALLALRSSSDTNDSAVFKSRKGAKPLGERHIREIIAAAASKAGIQGNVSPHWCGIATPAIVLTVAHVCSWCSKPWGILRYRPLAVMLTPDLAIVVGYTCLDRKCTYALSTPVSVLGKSGRALMSGYVDDNFLAKLFLGQLVKIMLIILKVLNVIRKYM